MEAASLQGIWGVPPLYMMTKELLRVLNLTFPQWGLLKAPQTAPSLELSPTPLNATPLWKWGMNPPGRVFSW